MQLVHGTLIGWMLAVHCGATAGSELSKEQAPELGRVAWRRELDSLLATEKLAAYDRPLLVLFQEVPG